MTGDEPQGTMGRVETAGELCMSIKHAILDSCDIGFHVQFNVKFPVESFPRCQNSAVN